MFQVPVPDVNPSSSSSSQQSNNRRSNRSNSSSARNIDYLDDSDDGRNGNSRSDDSMQVAPLPRDRGQRTQPPRQLTPERMRDMSPQERSQNFQTFNRGFGG